MTLAERIAETAGRLTGAERQVAQIVADDPKIVAFGTVALLAARSGTSGPTVLRFAAKLGFRGFAELQSAVQAEIADALRPATERIRERPTADVMERALTADLENVRVTLEGVDSNDYRGAVELLSDRRRRVYVLAGEVARGVGVVFGTQLDLLREAVIPILGSPVKVARQLADIEPRDVVVAIDHRRYERWLLEAVRRAAANGASIIAVTDSSLSPLADAARYTFVVSARGAGPFDSQVGTLAFVQALAAGVAARLRRSATERLDAIEKAWRTGNELVEG
jgi:DNA-binding MurR/RpiR family transcriptional regulator